jgi:hypothetical protein
MIRGLHGLFYSSDVAATRKFLKDQLKLPYNDVGEGWLIFDLPEADLGVHPIDDGAKPGGHDVSFYCDDIQGTVRDLESRGVTFRGDIEDHGYGLVTYLDVPGGLRVQLYEPRYVKKTRVGKAAARAASTVQRAAKQVRKKAAKKKGAAKKKKGAAKKKKGAAKKKKGAAKKKKGAAKKRR